MFDRRQYQPVVRNVKKLLFSFWLLLWALCSPGVIAAQETPIYSSDTAPADSATAVALLTRANRLQGITPDSTIQLARLALSFATKAKFYAGAGRALGLMATGYRNLGNYEHSIVLYKEALHFIERQRTGREFITAAVYTAMVGAYFPRGMYDSAAINCYKVIDIYNKANGRTIDPPNAPVSPLIDAYQYIGICWQKLGYYQYALKYISQAERLSVLRKDHYGLMSILNNKAATLLAEDNVPPAREAAEKGRRLASKEGNREYQDIFDIDVAICYRQEGQPAKAAWLLEQILKDSLLMPDENKINASYQLAVSCYILKQYSKALSFIISAMKKAEELGLRHDAAGHQRLLSEIYREMGDEAKAYKHLRFKEILEDSMTASRKAQALNLMDISIRTADKDRKIAEKLVQINEQKSRIRQQWLWIASISACAIFVIILLVMIYHSSRHKRNLQEEKIRTLSKEQEILSLKAFVGGEEKERTRFARELHDGFISQLSAIRMNFASLPENNNAVNEFQEYVGQLDEAIAELRKTTQNLVPEILLKGGGLAEAVQVYCDRMAKAHGLTINFQVYGFLPELGAEFELSVHRMIQEAIQNVVKHADATLVIVQMNYAQGVLGITVEDNGRGIVFPDKQTRGGLGLANMRARANALNGVIQISGTPDVGTTVYFEFEI
jgi:two-component system NarL family sensor kinase